MAVYAVSEVTSYVRDTLERDASLQDIWVSGEVANLARPGSGHAYFSLRDGRSTLRCVMFRSNSGGTANLENGAAVIAHGRVSVYEPRGDLQLIVDLVQPEGVGELQLQFEALKLKLEAEGLFDPSRKRPLPPFPQRVGVITSPTGAAWQDIQKVTARRYPLVELALAPAAVQGASAAATIVDAFRAANAVADIDVVILARGGGSLEDLWPFNEEGVARAVFASRAPVISGVGHETDTTIADLVADRRAPTPSAAAEMAVPDQTELAKGLLVAEQALLAGVRGNVMVRRHSVEQLVGRLRGRRPDLDTARMMVDDRLARASVHLRHAMGMHAERLDALQRRLASLSPRDTLRRGYAVVATGDDGRVVSSADQVEAGDSLHVTLAQGSLSATVEATHPAGGARRPTSGRPGAP